MDFFSQFFSFTFFFSQKIYEILFGPADDGRTGIAVGGFDGFYARQKKTLFYCLYRLLVLLYRTYKIILIVIVAGGGFFITGVSDGFFFFFTTTTSTPVKRSRDKNK